MQQRAVTAASGWTIRIFCSYNLVAISAVQQLIEIDWLTQIKCQDMKDYVIPDPTQRDRYLKCPEDKVNLCPKGCIVDASVGAVDVCTPTPKDRSAGRLTYSEDKGKVVETEFKRDTCSTAHDMPAKPVPSQNIIDSQDKSGNIHSGDRMTTPTPLKALGGPAESNVVAPSSFLNDVECEGSDVYVVPDPEFCDSYLDCPAGEVRMCDEGESLDLQTGSCADSSSVDCVGRERNFRDLKDFFKESMKEEVHDLVTGH